MQVKLYYSLDPILVDVLESFAETNSKAKRPKYPLKSRDRDVMKKRKGALEIKRSSVLGIKMNAIRASILR